MDLLATCPFRSLMALFLAVPIGVIAGIYAIEVATGLRHRFGSIRTGSSASDRRAAADQPPMSPVAASIP